LNKDFGTCQIIRIRMVNEKIVFIKNKEEIIKGYNKQELLLYIKEQKKEAILEFIDLLNHNKRKIFIGETRDVNDISLNLEFLKGLVI